MPVSSRPSCHHHDNQDALMHNKIFSRGWGKVRAKRGIPALSFPDFCIVHGSLRGTVCFNGLYFLYALLYIKYVYIYFIICVI